MTAGGDCGHLEPMLDATRRRLQAAGVEETPGVVPADAGYWHQPQMERAIAQGSQVLIPFDTSRLRSGALADELCVGLVEPFEEVCDERELLDVVMVQDRRGGLCERRVEPGGFGLVLSGGDDKDSSAVVLVAQPSDEPAALEPIERRGGGGGAQAGELGEPPRCEVWLAASGVEALEVGWAEAELIGDRLMDQQAVGGRAAHQLRQTLDQLCSACQIFLSVGLSAVSSFPARWKNIVSGLPGKQAMSVTATPISPEDEAAITGLLDGLREAWERGDGAGYASMFSDDARYVSATGVRSVGREQIASSHQRIFDSLFAATRLGSSYPVELQPVAPGVVLVHGVGAVLFPGEREQRVAPNGLLTMVAVAGDRGWRVASFANTPTGKARNARFVLRYLRSRFAASRAEASKARAHMLRQKREDIARWSR